MFVVLFFASFATSLRSLRLKRRLNRKVRKGFRRGRKGILPDNRQHIAFPHEEQFVIADLEFFTCIRQEQYFVPFLDLENGTLSIIEESSFADADDRPAGRLVFGGVGQIKSAFGLFFGGFTPNDDTVAERLQFCALARMFTRFAFGHIL